MFNVKLQRAVFERNQRRYSIQGLLPGTPGPPPSFQTHPYRYSLPIRIQDQKFQTDETIADEKL